MMNPELDENTWQQYKDEYKQASSNLQHYSNLRFAIFTVLLVIQAAFISYGLDVASQSSEKLTTMVKIGGLITTFVFWVFHERLIMYRKFFLKRAIYLEEKLGYDLYLSLPKAFLGFLSTSFVSRLFFLILGVFWVISLIMS